MEAIFRHSCMCSTALHTILHKIDYGTQHVDCHLRYNSSFLIETVMESIRLLFICGVSLFSQQVISDFILAGQEILCSPQSSTLALGPTQPSVQSVQGLFRRV